jgi:hypothetical protein
MNPNQKEINQQSTNAKFNLNHYLSNTRLYNNSNDNSSNQIINNDNNQTNSSDLLV